MTYQSVIAQYTCYILSYLNFVYNTDGSAHMAVQMTLISHPMCSSLLLGPRGFIYAMEPESFGAKIRAMKYP